jgi:hypothetical protein
MGILASKMPSGPLLKVVKVVIFWLFTNYWMCFEDPQARFYAKGFIPEESLKSSRDLQVRVGRADLALF